MMPAIPHMATRLPSGSEGQRRSRQHLEVLLTLPVGDRRQVTLPLVALVVLEHVVEAAGHGAADQLVPLERLERRPQALRDALQLDAFLEEVVGVSLLRRAGIDLALKAVQAGLEQGGDRQ